MDVAGQRYRGLSPMGREAPGVAAIAPVRSATGWELVNHNPRTLLVSCFECHRSIVNETNQMRRSGWMELRVGRNWLYRCGRCSGVPA